MNGTFKLVAPLLVALTIAACNGGSSNVPASPGQSTAQTRFHSVVPEWLAKGLARPVCPQLTGKPACMALTEKGIQPACTGSSCGIAPSELQARYKLPITKGSGEIVAIVDAGDNPDVASSLATYRTEFGLGTANFFKYNQTGQQSNYPPPCCGFPVEIALDVEMVSASCPLCTIYLVEANSASSSDLSAAEMEAQTLGAKIISNSYSCQTTSGSCGLTGFDTPGIMYLAASGDSGYDHYGPPSTFPTVVAVGGTQITGGGTGETVWDGAGAGCVSGMTKPSWQHDPDCTGRTDSDISAQAGVSPGVSVYDEYDGGWFGVGGTSVASPLLAGVFALAGNASHLDAAKKFWTLKKKKLKHDIHAITTGNDGSCGGEYLCTAGTGQYKTYSGPGGWGTPNGIKAF